MKIAKSTQKAALAVALGLSLGLSEGAKAITIDFANVSGAIVRFDGNNPGAGLTGSFQFLPASPANQFIITASDGVGDARDKLGRMDGTFNIGAITTSGLAQTAPVTGSGTLRIHDGAGNDLTATVIWDEIATMGTGGIINVNGILNLSTVTYSGAVADFVALAQAGVGTEVVTFQFVPGRTLTQLTTDGAVNTTSFSGNITSPSRVPETGATITMLGLGLLGLGLFSWRKGLAKA